MSRAASAVAGDRSPARRYAATLAASLLLHLLLLWMLAGWAGEASAIPAEEELLVPIELAPEPDDRLLGFRSEGEEPGEPDRPPVPESELPGVPPPEEGAPIDAAPAPAPAQAPPEPAPPDERPPAEPERTADEAAPSETPPEAPEEPPPEALEERGAGPEEETLEESAPAIGAPEPLPPRPEPPPAAQPSPAPTPPAGAEPSGPARIPDLDIPLEGGLAGGDLRFDSPDYDWSDYATKIYFAIYRAWLRELDAHLLRIGRDQKIAGEPTLEFDTVVHFVIRREGSITDVDVLMPSVNRSGDDAAVSALRRAVLPALPDDFPRDSEGVTGVFRVRADSIHQIERWLRRLKAAGRL